ncbi:phage Gp37/Gp68 family protein [bacterium]|nr:phage Gp37/Gp68 family protein [bacterium]
MSLNSKIEWTEASWNPVTGCTKVSPGCENCYAERISIRLQAMGQPNYVNGFKPTIHDNSLGIPLKWKKPRLIFVNSMSDLFHEKVPDKFILRTIEIMNKANWHRFQILTKRSKRLTELNSKIKWAQNIWMGVSVENMDYLFRIDHLRNTDSKIKFISFEPLLGPISNLNLKDVDWVIVGGESGPKARPMNPEWVKEIRNQCVHASVPFFFKQWGGVNKKKNGRKLDGRTWDEMPLTFGTHGNRLF